MHGLMSYRRFGRAHARARSLRSDRAEHAFGCCVATLFELLSDFSLTHEKIRCPLLRRGSLKEKQQASESHSGEKTHQNAGSAPPKANPSCKLLEGPPGFPPLFPELSKEEQKMAMLYISHADDTERRARIERVMQGIEANTADSTLRITKITNELNKGKGHVFDYSSFTERSHSCKQARKGISSDCRSKSDQLEEEAESSATNGCVFSAPVLASTDFQLGSSSGGRVSAITNGKKSQRKRPPVWKRRNGLRQHGAPLSSTAHVPTPQLSMKRKSSPPPSSVIDLTLTISDLLLPNSSAWDAALVRRTFTDHDTEIILRLKPNKMQEDGYKWGFTKDGIYTSRSGYRFVDSFPEEDGFSKNSVFLNMYHLLEMSRKSPKDSDTISFPLILWHLWKARNSLAFEKIHYSSVSVLSKARAEAAVWFELNTAQTE
ncbi:hypothetical protein F2Q69_00047240 [Brassica cretica]|uniref:Uncharacterized protein n=1 Tax=Brassica cretica TaxID=69181 RepID=A0A8S9PKI8_BRACR|nr:hypothetical protein F2Q69_00047240 [Brassica cretica]